MKSKKELIIFFYGIAVCFLFIDALFPLLTYYKSQQTGIDQPNTVYQIIAASFYLIAVFLVLLDLSKFLILFKRLWLVWLIVLFAMVSTAWSVEKLVTLKSSIALFGTTLIGFIFIEKFTLKDLLRILLVNFFIVNLLSVYFSLSFPEMSVHSDIYHDGLWKGAFSHKNIMARNVSLSIIVSCLYFFELSSRRLLSILLLIVNLGLSAFLLMMSGGKSGLIISLFGVALLYPFSKLILRSARSFILFVNSLYFGGVALLLIIGYVMLHAEELLAKIGGDLTLTGRTLIWVVLVPFIKDKIVLGYGYDSFWDSNNIETFAVLAGWSPPHAHNAFLDLLLNFGILGGSLFILLLLRTIFGGRSYFRHDPHATVVVVILFYLLAYAIPGSLIVSQNSLSWILMIYFYYTTNFFKRPI